MLNVLNLDGDLTFSFRESTPASKAVQRQLAAYNNHDIEAFVAAYSSDVQLIDLETGKILCSGKAEFKKRYDDLFTHNPSLHCELLKRTSIGNFVYDEERVIGHPLGDVRAMLTYHVNEEGLIDKVWTVKEENKK